MYKSKVTVVSELKKKYKDYPSGNDAVQTVFTENYFIPGTEQSVMYRSRFSTYTRGIIAELFKEKRIANQLPKDLQLLMIPSNAEAAVGKTIKEDTAAAAAAGGSKVRKT